MADYPKIGSILISKSGSTLVHVWPNESSSRRCFTGVSLLDGDCSCLWLRGHFEAQNIFKSILMRRYRKSLKAARLAEREQGKA